MNRFFVVTSAFIIGVTLATAQDGQAEQYFNNAATFIAAGKYNEALADYQHVIDNYPTSKWAPKAMLEIGNYYLTVRQDYGSALQFYRRIQSDYPQNREVTPAAMYWQGYIADRTSDHQDGLKDAVGNLMRMTNIFQGNDWLDGGHFLIGKMNMRLDDFPQSLAYFQILEFKFPNSPFTPQALLYSSHVAYITGRTKAAALILSRLQSRYPQSGESKDSESFARLLNRFARGEIQYQLDREFIGGAPKRYSNPVEVCVGQDGLVGIIDQKGIHFATKGERPKISGSVKDIKSLCLDQDNRMLLVFGNRVTHLDGTTVFSNLSCNGDDVDRIVSAAIDHLGRLYVIDGSIKDINVFDRSGKHIKTIASNKAKHVHRFGSQVWIAKGDGTALTGVDAQFNSVGSLSAGLSSITDFCFDSYGNPYVLFDKGRKVAIFDHAMNLRAVMNLKNGGFPLKQAAGLAVDDSGALYLADRRGGAVYRFL